MLPCILARDVEKVDGRPRYTGTFMNFADHNILCPEKEVKTARNPRQDIFQVIFGVLKLYISISYKFIPAKTLTVFFIAGVKRIYPQSQYLVFAQVINNMCP
jgi:hypothetical protein